MELLQNGRLLKVTTALGPDSFLLRRLSVTEALEQCYAISGELVSANPALEVKPADILGTPITCTISQEEAGTERHFHGIVSAFGATGSTLTDRRVFRFEAVPAFWLLTRTMDCRIFQDKSVKDIVQSIVDERGVGPVTFTHMPSGTRPYCTQFNESDHDFIHRLLDEIGGTYFFDQTEGSDGWTVVGGAAGFPSAERSLVVRADSGATDAVTNWTSLSVVQPAKQKTWDFDNLKPSQLLVGESPTMLATKDATSKLEVYRWPGGQAVRPDAGATADLRMRRNEAGHETWTGCSREATLFPGQKVKIQTGLTAAEEPWLLTGVTHDAYDETHIVGEASAAYSNSFTCIPVAQAWRSPVHRPRPMIPGVQSAIVTGPSGEEIYTDEYGRVKLHFLWDHRDDKKNETSSCWVRCMQSYGGSWGGMWTLPRIGDEVLVAFQDGDPDRPIVIGSVYNADGKPPWTLGSHDTRSGIRSRSTKGGGRDNANIVGFDDKKGSEQFYVQAEKDYLELVKNQKKVTVKGNEIHDVTGESSNQSQGNRTTTVKGNETLEVKQGNREATIAMGNETLTVKMGNMEVKVSMGNITITADMGNIDIKAKLGAITIDGMQGVTLKGGPTSTIEVLPTGIAFKSLKIDTKADLLNQTQGAIEQQSGQGMQKVGGAITMIG